MNTVIKGTKTIAEYKRVREDMENLASNFPFSYCAAFHFVKGKASGRSRP